jgi:hypothetical protein
LPNGRVPVFHRSACVAGQAKFSFPPHERVPRVLEVDRPA